MNKTTTVRVKTGGKVPISGQYRAGSGKTEITLVKSTKAPPNRGKLQTWHLVDKTKHKK
jgi:hypothetical protein